MPGLMVNPSDYSGDKVTGNRVGPVGAGRKVLFAIGYDYKVFNGKDCLRINFVCLKDLDENNDEGNVITSNFYLTQKAIWRLGVFANRVGYNAQFDPFDRDSIERIMCMAPVACMIEITENGDYTYRNIKSFESASWPKASDGQLEFTPDQLQQINAAEENWERLLNYSGDKKKESPVKAASSGMGNDFSDVPF
jgi:hypothetical protein